MEFSRDQCCCFTGHRRLSRRERALLPQLLEEEIRRTADLGIDCFLSGGARGFDTLAAQAVLRLRDSGMSHHQLKLWMVLPCRDQASLWPPFDQELWRRILSRADKITFTAEEYNPGVMSLRNAYLVDHSARCICWQKPGVPGGTAQTVAMARDAGLELVPLAAFFPED